MYTSVEDALPEFDVIVRTYHNDPDYTQKAMLKADGWYFPSGNEKLPEEIMPTHWQAIA